MNRSVSMQRGHEISHQSIFLKNKQYRGPRGKHLYFEHFNQ